MRNTSIESGTSLFWVWVSISVQKWISPHCDFESEFEMPQKRATADSSCSVLLCFLLLPLLLLLCPSAQLLSLTECGLDWTSLLSVKPTCTALVCCSQTQFLWDWLGLLHSTGVTLLKFCLCLITSLALTAFSLSFPPALQKRGDKRGQ